MLKKLRKSSSRVTLVLIGVAALGGCGRGGDDARRDVYATREDCLADWGNRPADCTPATEERHRTHGYYYGPSYNYRSGSGSSGSTWSSRSSSGRSIGSSGVSRGGFGSSAHSSGG